MVSPTRALHQEVRFIFVQVLTLGGENPQPVNLISAIDLGKATLRGWSPYVMLEPLRDRIPDHS
ncbi:MAG: hypothetical protein F6K56_35825 [Moorea sp. SIO3G5]|nr:hypothetical protein [Moorena sp. SIO3G5]